MPQRKAVFFGINHYDHAQNLGCCINDANLMAKLLDAHAAEALQTQGKTGRKNFHSRVRTSDLYSTSVADLRNEIHTLFSGRAEVSLFYFSGHGARTDHGSYLVASDAQKPHYGFSMSELLEAANRAVRENRHGEVIIIIDCCYSGNMGNLHAFAENMSFLQEGVSILTASEHDQESLESNGHGIFTEIICEALDGGAADILGRTTVASVYNYADQMLGPFEQRPQLKAHVSESISLRDLPPKVPVSILMELPYWFENPCAVFRLDPSFEPDSGEPEAQNVEVFRKLQKLNRIGLIATHGLPDHRADHMYYAAMLGAGCVLTGLGRFYWRIASEGKL